ncbi:MAG: MFS transporter [Rhodobacteraceae bacterium]|nr:MFS transporter [Paracoccaceae bacterium]
MVRPYQDSRKHHALRFRLGDAILSGILVADFFGAIAASLVFLTMVWWVLEQNTSDFIFGLMMLTIVLPLNIGVLVSGPAVARIGARKLLLRSKLAALLGAAICFSLLALDLMTLPVLAIIAIVTYFSLGPSVTADLSRAPAIVRLAGRRLIDFNAVNGLAMLIGSVAGFWLAGLLNDRGMAATSLGIAVLCVAASTLATWASFPRDRFPQRFEGSGNSHFWHLVRRVFTQLRSTVVIRNAAICSALLLTASDVYEDIFLPLILRAENFPPSVLSLALIASLIASAVVSVVAPLLYEKARLVHVFRISAVAAFLVLGLHIFGSSLWVIFAAIVVMALGAGVTGTIGFTVMQEKMPQSLQAQAVGIWQSFSMTFGSCILVIGGWLGTDVLWLVAALMLACVIFCSALTFDDQT